MSSTTARTALAFFILLSAPAASFAQIADEAGAGNLPISCIPPGPANVGGLNNVLADPSDIGNAFRMAPLPLPPITVPVIPQFK
jgi:hypothetical protein